VNPTPFPLSDAEWNRLSSRVGLPENARPELSNILGMGRFFMVLDESLPSSKVTRKRLKKIRNKAEKLIEALVHIESDALGALLEGGSTEFGDAPAGGPSMFHFRLLQGRTDDVRAIVKWFSLAEDRLPRGKSGNKNSGAHLVSREVDRLLRRHTGRGLTTNEKADDSGRELLQTCFDLLDVEIDVTSAIRRLKRKSKVPVEKSSATVP
jgi:hypothetical protein